MNKDLCLGSVERFADYDLQADTDLHQLLKTASKVCDAAIAAITLFNGSTLQIKVCTGINIKLMPPQLSFCNYTVQQTDVLVIPDTLKSKKYDGRLLVTPEPNIRFYAGAPLIDNTGVCVGTFSITDARPKKLNKYQKMMLAMLAKQALTTMELKLSHKLLVKHEREVQEQKRINTEADIKLRSFFKSSVNFHVLLGKHFEVIDYNKTAFDFIEKAYGRAIIRDTDFTDYIEPSFKPIFTEHYKACLKGQKAYEEGYTDYPDLGRIWWEASFEPATNSNMEIIGISYIIRNVTERKLYEQKIIAQNQSLMHISYVQSHEYRGPLASILGLMNLIKYENYNASVEYLQMMDIAVNRLDDKIGEVVRVASQLSAMPG